jgi:amidohydrolase
MANIEHLWNETEALRERLIATRRDLHAHPELGFEEVRTAGIVAQRLGELGYEVQTGIGKTGVVGILDGAAAGSADAPVLLARFDMDALPVREENDVPYRSQRDGLMHACGHDAHTAIGLAVAELMARHRADWPGTLKLVFQPAEEMVGGALAMIKDGVLESPKPTYALSMHVDSGKPLGTVHITDGPMMAATDSLKIAVKGRGTHGAQPQAGTDTILAAAHIITALQSVVSRNVNPLDQAVVTVGMIHGGSALNIIPELVEIGGTMRSYKPEVTELLRKRVREIAENTARAMGVEAVVTFAERVTPATVNDPVLAEQVRRVARQLVGAPNVYSDYRLMGSEDASYFLQAMPGAYVFVGAGNVDKGISEPHHSPRFMIDEDALPIGVTLITATALDILNRRMDEHGKPD